MHGWYNYISEFQEKLVLQKLHLQLHFSARNLNCNQFSGQVRPRQGTEICKFGAPSPPEDLHWIFCSFSSIYVQFSKTSPLKSGESSEKSSGENRVKSCHVCGCHAFFGPEIRCGQYIMWGLWRSFSGLLSVPLWRDWRCYFTRCPPNSAIRFRGKFFLRYPPPPKACLWTAIGHCYGKWGCSSDSLRHHRKHSATGVLP